MLKKSFAVFICAAAFGSACQSTETTNKNNGATSAANVSSPANTSSTANLPPEFSGTPSVMTNSAPGIPADAKSATINISNATTPIPGITDVKNNGKPQPKNTPPILGIPSEAELKRQMNTRITNSKVMERKPPVGEVNAPAGAIAPAGPMARPRGNQKP